MMQLQCVLFACRSSESVSRPDAIARVSCRPDLLPANLGVALL